MNDGGVEMIALVRVKGEKVETIWTFNNYENALDYYKMYCRGQKDIKAIPMAGQMYTIK